MMDCTNADVRDMLPDYVGGRLSAADRGTVERHLAGCAECAAELSLVRSAARALSAAPSVDVARIVAALPAPPRRATPGVVPIESRRPSRVAPRRGWASPRRVAAIAAALVGAVGLAVVGGDRTTQRDTTVAAAPVAARVATRSPVVATAPAESVPAGGVQLASASAELSLGTAVAELSDESLRALLGDLDHLDDSALTEPAEPLPAVTGLDEESGV